MSINKIQKAFTLAELLVAIFIIALLTSMSVYSVSNYRSKSRDTQRVNDISQIQMALEKYYNKNNNRIKCPYLSYNSETKQYKWDKIPDDVVFIFDEAHRCSSLATDNGKLLLSVKESTSNKIMWRYRTISEQIAA